MERGVHDARGHPIGYLRAELGFADSAGQRDLVTVGDTPDLCAGQTARRPENESPTRSRGESQVNGLRD
jgi:hypothetical protein